MRALRFDVEDDLYMWIKTQAAKERRSMKDLLIEALEGLQKERRAKGGLNDEPS